MKIIEFKKGIFKDAPMVAENFDQLVFVGNSRTNIIETNYWDTEQAHAGLCFASINAGAVRLLVPKASESLIKEMRTGKKVTIERSITGNRQLVDIVFEDGTSSPFFLGISKLQFDFVPLPQLKMPFSVWTEKGKQLEFFAKVDEL